MSDPRPLLRPCDILLSTSTGVFSAQIRWWTRSWREGPTLVSHAALCVQGGPPAQAVMHDALAAGKRNWRDTLWNIYGAERTAVAIIRQVNLPPECEHVILESADQEHGRLRLTKFDYNYRVLAAQLADALLLDAYLFRRLISPNSIPVCSYSVARHFWAAGYSFGMEPRKASPDDIYDFWQRRPWRYRQIWPEPSEGEPTAPLAPLPLEAAP